MRRTLLLIPFLLLVFAAGKVAFLLYNADVEPFAWSDAADVLRHGFLQDLSTTAYLVAPVWLTLLVGVWTRGLRLRRTLAPYYIIIGILLGAIIGGDTVLYAFWKFKLDAAVFAYLASPEGAANSVSTVFLITRVAAVVVLMGLIVVGLITITPRRLRAVGHRLWASAAMLMAGGLLFLCIRGGIGTGTMNVGAAYFSPRLYLNHAAVNPAFSLIHSLVGGRKAYAAQYDYLPEARRRALFDGLYGQTDQRLTDTLLAAPRPNVLLVLMESFGGKVYDEPSVAPNLHRYAREGIAFTHYYSNSFRTDRGTLSALSGHISYPTVSLMKDAARGQQLPSLARSLRREGYATRYLYGGDITFTNLSGYLLATGFQHLTSDHDFTLREAHESKWGVNDRTTARRVVQELKSQRRPFFYVYQTLSSHEPFEVPFQRLADAKLNAFAFTDDCLGQLLDTLRRTPLWPDLLVVLIPDHGFLYHTTYEDPAFFHCPMLWVGGAVRRPRQVDALMNQSDIAATLLAQMGLPHADFPWSRNVLSPLYRYPFAYSTFPSGILFRDSTGVTVYDITSQRPITERPAPNAQRTERAKAILQTSYDRLDVK